VKDIIWSPIGFVDISTNRPTAVDLSSAETSFLIKIFDKYFVIP